MNILLCCSSGFSTSILVKVMREEAKKMNHDDYKIAAVGTEQVHLYLSQTDVVLVAPQNIMEYQHVKELAERYDIPVFLINRDDYGEMDGKSVLLKMQEQLNNLNREGVKMDKFSAAIESKVMPVAMRIGSNKVLTVIRNAMVSTMSLLIIGSISVLLTNFPVESIANFMEPAVPFLNAVYLCTSGMLGLFTAASMAYYGSIEYRTDVISTILTSVSTFLLTQVSSDGTLNVDGLGSSGLATAMIIGLVTVLFIDLFKKKNWVIKMPNGVPEAVSESFTSLIPAVLILIMFGSISFIFGFNLNDVVSTILSPIASIINNPFGYAIYHMLCALVFFLGINSAVVIGIVVPFILQNGVANEAAHFAGEELQFIATVSTDILIWSGGTGATIGLVFIMAFLAKSKAFKTLGRMSLGPGIFNINEPVIFGTPIVFNPIFFIPFVGVPGILAFLTYLLMDLGFVAIPVVGVVPWTLPPVIAGFVMSNGALSTVVWSIAVLIISLVAYFPFFKIADKAEYKKELEAEKADQAI